MASGTVYRSENYIIWIIPSFSLLNHKKHSKIKSPPDFRDMPSTFHSSLILYRALRVVRTKNIPEEWIGLMVLSEDGRQPTFKNVRIGYVDEENEKSKGYIGEWIEHSDDCKYFQILKFINKREYRWRECPSLHSRRFVLFQKGYLFATRNMKQKNFFANAYTQTENENGVGVKKKEVECTENSVTSLLNISSSSCAIQNHNIKTIEAAKNGLKHKENSDSVLLNLGRSPCAVENQDIKDLEKLSQNLKNLFTTGKDSDVTIKVKDREFKAHKAILRVRSSVFDKMFSHGFSESNTGFIPIEDCEPDAFEEFMFFIYTGKTQNLSSDNACQLYYIADKYDIPELKEKCVSQLKKSISTETICDIIYLATKHKEPELLDLGVKFFARNMEEILLTVKWQVFIQENPIEANELHIKSLKLLKIDFSKIDI